MADKTKTIADDAAEQQEGDVPVDSDTFSPGTGQSRKLRSFKYIPTYINKPHNVPKVTMNATGDDVVTSVDTPRGTIIWLPSDTANILGLKKTSDKEAGLIATLRGHRHGKAVKVGWKPPGATKFVTSQFQMPSNATKGEIGAILGEMFKGMTGDARPGSWRSSSWSHPVIYG